jgi:hypothetical protein
VLPPPSGSLTTKYTNDTKELKTSNAAASLRRGRGHWGKMADSRWKVGRKKGLMDAWILGLVQTAPGIPTGYNHSAQCWPSRPTPGYGRPIEFPNPEGIQSESTTHILFVRVLKHATKPDFENKTAVLLAKLNVLINPGRNEGGQSFSPDEDGR